jgi:hypothetical protein
MPREPSGTPWRTSRWSPLLGGLSNDAFLELLYEQG